MISRRKLFGLIPIPLLAAVPYPSTTPPVHPSFLAEEKPWEGHGYVGNFMTIVGGLADETIHRKLPIVSMDCAGLSDDELDYAIKVGQSAKFSIRIDPKTIRYAWVDGRGDIPTVSFLFWEEDGRKSWTWICFYDEAEDDWRFDRYDYDREKNDWVKYD